MVCKTFDKETTSLTVKIASGGAAKRATMPNQELAWEVHKPNIQKLKNEKYTHLLSDIADMQLISKFNKTFRFWLCVIDIYSQTYGSFL